MLQDLTGVKIMTWVHDEHITICQTEKDTTPKLMLEAKCSPDCACNVIICLIIHSITTAIHVYENIKYIIVYVNQEMCKIIIIIWSIVVFHASRFPAAIKVQKILTYSKYKNPNTKVFCLYMFFITRNKISD